MAGGKQMNDVTFVIKTLERPYCLFRLVKSIRRYYPDAEILIGDDSEMSCRAGILKRYGQEGITVYELPHDCGISYGRNELVRKVKTQYFVLLDDDFVFDRKTDIESGLEVLKKHGMDVCGGYFRKYPVLRGGREFLKYLAKRILYRPQDYNYLGFIEENGDEVRVRYYTNRFPDFERTDIVHNFFIARTDEIRNKCLWDDAIKICEHTPFFIKAKRAGVRVGFTNCMSVQHKPIKLRKYTGYRNRSYVREWMKIYGFTRFVSTMNGGDETVVEG